MATVIGEGWNRNITARDPTAHAEIVALREAGTRAGNHRLPGCDALRDAGAVRDVRDGDGACASGARRLRRARSRRPAPPAACSTCLRDPRHNHRVVEVRGGVLAGEASARLTNYFRTKRGKAPL